MLKMNRGRSIRAANLCCIVMVASISAGCAALRQNPADEIRENLKAVTRVIALQNPRLRGAKITNIQRRASLGTSIVKIFEIEYTVQNGDVGFVFVIDGLRRDEYTFDAGTAEHRALILSNEFWAGNGGGE